MSLDRHARPRQEAVRLTHCLRDENTFHDYLAMGKPVVTTNIGGAEDLKDVVRIADTPAAFLSQIEAALADDSPDFIQQRKKVAFENSWPNRIKEVEKVLISNQSLAARQVGAITKYCSKASISNLIDELSYHLRNDGKFGLAEYSKNNYC